MPKRSIALGEGHHECPEAYVRCVEGDSRKVNRPCFVTLAFQVSQHRVEVNEYPRHILTQYPAGPQFRNNASHLRPEVTVVARASSLPGQGERLAGEAPANKVNWFQVGGSALSHVPVPADVGPVFLKDSGCIIVDLYLPLARHVRPFEAEIQPADPGKE